MDLSKEKAMLENIANEYIDTDPGRIVDRKILAMVVEHIMPWLKGPDVLEMGFGDDAWTSSVIDKFGSSYIVDASETLLAQAKEKYGEKITVYNSLFESFNPPQKFDTVIASFILEHVDDPVQIMRNAAQWIHTDGQVIAIVPNAHSYHRRVAVAMGLHNQINDIGDTDHQMGHRRVYTVKTMQEDIKQAGLNVVDQKGYFLKFLPQGKMTEFSDELLLGFMKLSEEIPMEDCATIAFSCKLNT